MTNFSKRSEFNEIKSTVDLKSLAILKETGKFNGADMPVSTTPDGSCFFNAVSLLLYGDETMALELRVQTLMQLFRDYDNLCSNSDTARKCSPDIDDVINDCMAPNGFSSHLTITALCCVICQPIDVMYPPIGSSKLCSNLLSRLYLPEKCVFKSPLRIMWTSTSINDKPDKIRINHFVPLFDIGDTNEKINYRKGLYAAEAYHLSQKDDRNGSSGIKSLLKLKKKFEDQAKKYMNKDIINEKNVSESNSSQIKLHEIIYSDEVSNNFDETDTEILNKTVVSRSQNCSDCGTDI